MFSIKPSLNGFDKERFFNFSYSFYAKNFLAKKNFLTSKYTLVHQKLISLLYRFPYYLDKPLFEEMERFFALAFPEFLSQRQTRHLTSLICSIYLIRKSLFREMSILPHLRHIKLRFINRPLPKLRLRRFWGLFWPIFDSFFGDSIRSVIQSPKNESKTRLKRTPKATKA